MDEVRLVIWDLDETFWKGTVTEGGHTYSQECHDIVVELAKRGIVSSVVSKNDAETVHKILEANQIAGYFVFRSVDWTSKGPRIAALVTATKLRPENIIFIDDNPMNLAEAKHFCPGIQVSDETIIPRILADPRFSGKDDARLSRLSQYKILEQKRLDEHTSSDNIQFLQDSEIRVFIDHDVESNLPRAVELINRTNQLNYTKRRLPEDAEPAAQRLLDELREYDTTAGLVYARDKYGDYGCIGFYALRDREGMKRRLTHFCFSCRTLGMFIERWLYERLGRPDIGVVGTVLTDLKVEAPTVNWVTEVHSAGDLGRGLTNRDKLPRLIVRGGCDVRAIGHYVDGLFERSYEEMNDVAEGVGLRTDHSIFLQYALGGVSPEAIEAAKPLGFRPSHFSSQLSTLIPGDRAVVLLSLWSDGRLPLYRDRQTGIRLPYWLPNQPANMLDADLDSRSPVQPAHRTYLRYLKEHFLYEGEIPIDEYRQILQGVNRTIPESALVILIKCPTYWHDGPSGDRYSLVREPILNEVGSEIFSQRRHAAMLNPHDFAHHTADYLDFFHFSRGVYFRMGRQLRSVINSYSEQPS